MPDATFAGPPAFSVLVPTFRRLDVLERALDAWERQTPTSLPFEVVVVDDGSGDATLERVAARRSRRYPLRLLSQPNAGPAAARNRGLERARGAYVLFVGDDIEPAPDLLDAHLRAHRRLDDLRAAVLGLTRWPDAGHSNSRDSGVVERTATMRHIDGVGAQQFSYHFMRHGAVYDFRHLYTSNVSLRRDLLLGESFSTAFPAAAFEDAELGHRLAYRGLRIVYRAEAVARHHHPYDAAGFYRRQVRCGAMAAVLFAGAPELERWTRVRELAGRRLDLLAEPADDARRLDPVARDWPLWRRRAVGLAGRFDATDPEGIDPLLRAVFDLGFVEGLASALWPAEDPTTSQPSDTARRVLARVYAETIPAAVEETAASLSRRGVPFPASDRAALAEIAPDR